jgi:hypothetical protein
MNDRLHADHFISGMCHTLDGLNKRLIRVITVPFPIPPDRKLWQVLGYEK